MVERDTIFSSKVKYDGIFTLADFYKFCHEWLMEEGGLGIAENSYTEKLIGEAKDVIVKWTATREVTDYFKFELKIEFKVLGMTKVEVMRGNAKTSTNKGSVEIKVKGNLLRDYKGKFEISAYKKFARGIYEKWVISSRIDQMKDNLANLCNEFLSQSKAFLDLEGKK